MEWGENCKLGGLFGERSPSAIYFKGRESGARRKQQDEVGPSGRKRKH